MVTVPDPDPNPDLTFLTRKSIYFLHILTGLNGIYLPIQFTEWLLVEVALLLIGLTKTRF
jgi:hypothetical protein